MSRCLFVTGRLAAPSLRATLQSMPGGAEHPTAVLPISVAALMDARIVARHLGDAAGCPVVLVPGACGGDFREVEDKLGVRVVRGPRCLKDIPGFFGQAGRPEGYGARRAKIMAEIVDAHRMSPEALLDRAAYYRAGGADIIDLGCPAGGGYAGVGDAVRALKAAGFRVSVDSSDAGELRSAAGAGADYVLSLHSETLELAPGLGCPVVVVPDPGGGLESLERSMGRLEAWGVPYIADPVLEPIGLGFARSLGEFIALRQRHPRAEILMGTGNVTELTDADSTGTTALLAGIVAELGIGYVLTTEVIDWARGAVREMDIALGLMDYACRLGVAPKRIEQGLITVKDPPFDTFGEAELRAMHASVRDRNWRIFAGRDSLYVFNNRLFVKGRDPQSIFAGIGAGLEAAEAFYLGRELETAALALRLGKRYVQEEGLRWGYLAGGRAGAGRGGGRP